MFLDFVIFLVMKLRWVYLGSRVLQLRGSVVSGKVG